MNKRRIDGIVSFILIIIVIVLFGENNHGFILGDLILNKMGISVWSNGTTGLHYTGILALVVLVIGIVGVVRFRKDVHENFGKAVLLFFIIGSFVYQPVFDSAYGFVKSNMSGLSSIEYIPGESNFKFKSDDSNENILFDGQISLRNYSNNTKEFYIRLIPYRYLREITDLAPETEITILDEFNRPIKYILGPKSHMNLNAEFSAKQSSEVQNTSGSMSFDIIIYNDKEEKVF